MNDATSIAFFSGISIVLLFVLLSVAFVIPAINENWVEELGNGIVIYYCTAVVIYIFLAAGFCI
jgi:hypothetical protein